MFLHALGAIGFLASATGPSEPASVADAPQPVLELRQYKMLPGKRDTLIALFEDAFIESQEDLGIRLVGQFRALHDANRFVWIREFPGMAARGKALGDFYFGPVWKVRRNDANATIADSDNVLLLHPAAPSLDFNALPQRAARGAVAPLDGLIVANIHYLWADPGEGFTAFFQTEMMPRLSTAGLTVLAAYVPERTPNNFPRLPVRQHENVFVWFARVHDVKAWERAKRAVEKGQEGRAFTARRASFEERATQELLLQPTPRSALR